MRNLSVERLFYTLCALALIAATTLANDRALALDRDFGPEFSLGFNFDDENYGDYVVVSPSSIEADYAFPRRSSGFLAACLGDDAVYRGQSADSVIPPAESPTSTSTIGSSRVTNATADVVTPPVVGSDKPFDPQPYTPSNGEPTTFQKMFKYRQELSGYYMFIPKGSSRGLGFNEVNARLLFAIPSSMVQSVNNMNNGYFLLTPNFTYDYINASKDFGDWDGNFFDAGLTTTFLANYNDLEARADFSIGVSSSFKKITEKAIYLRGRAELGLPIDSEKQVRIFGGVQYLDTIKYKLLPVVGLTYNPNPQNQLRIAFPNPRWDHYLTKVNETDWWFFVHGDVVSRRWLTYSDEMTVRNNHTFNFDYSDYKVGLGVAFECPTRLRGSFEVGGSFGREVKTKLGKLYEPKDAVYLKVGLLY
ncbi:MAG: hypothetical protein ACOX0A_08440 [Thermoguttaceae bacterium]